MEKIIFHLKYISSITSLPESGSLQLGTAEGSMARGGIFLEYFWALQSAGLHTGVGAGGGLCGQHEVSLPRAVSLNHSCVPFLCSTATDRLYSGVRTRRETHVWKESQVTFTLLQTCQLKAFSFFFLWLLREGGWRKKVASLFTVSVGFLWFFFYPVFYSLTSESSLAKTFPFVGWTFKDFTPLSTNVSCYFVWMPGVIWGKKKNPVNRGMI